MLLFSRKKSARTPKTRTLVLGNPAVKSLTSYRAIDVEFVPSPQTSRKLRFFEPPVKMARKIICTNELVQFARKQFAKRLKFLRSFFQKATLFFQLSFSPIDQNLKILNINFPQRCILRRYRGCQNSIPRR